GAAARSSPVSPPPTGHARSAPRLRRAKGRRHNRAGMPRPRRHSLTRPATASSGNPAHHLLITKSAAEQAAMLGKATGNGCSGTTPFFMGITEDGSALWSVLCANGSSYVVNISPDPVGTTKALGCSRLQTMHLDCFSPLPESLRRRVGNML